MSADTMLYYISSHELQVNLGISRIFFLFADRTIEKYTFRYDRALGTEKMAKTQSRKNWNNCICDYHAITVAHTK